MSPRSKENLTQLVLVARALSFLTSPLAEAHPWHKPRIRNLSAYSIFRSKVLLQFFGQIGVFKLVEMFENGLANVEALLVSMVWRLFL